MIITFHCSTLDGAAKIGSVEVDGLVFPRNVAIEVLDTDVVERVRALGDTPFHFEFSQGEDAPEAQA